MGEDKFFSAEGSAKKDPQTNSPEAEKTASSSAQKSPNETLRSTQNSVADQNAANAVQQEKAKDSHSLEIDPASAEKQEGVKEKFPIPEETKPEEPKSASALSEGKDAVKAQDEEKHPGKSKRRKKKKHADKQPAEQQDLDQTRVIETVKPEEKTLAEPKKPETPNAENPQKPADRFPVSEEKKQEADLDKTQVLGQKQQPDLDQTRVIETAKPEENMVAADKKSSDRFPISEEKKTEKAQIVSSDSGSSADRNSVPVTAEPVAEPAKKEKKKWKKVLAITGGVLGLLIITVVVVMLLLSGSIERKLNVDTFYQGIYIEDVDLGGKTMEEAKELMADLEKRIRDEIDLTLTYQDQTFEYTEDDFQFTYDTDEVLEEAYQTGRDGYVWFRYFKVLMLKNNPEKFSLSHELEDTSVLSKQIAAEIADQVNAEPKDAAVEKFDPNAGSEIEEMFTISDAVTGVEVDQTKLAEDCKAILDGKEKKGTVAIPASETSYTMDKEEMLSHISLLGTYSTISHNNANGNHNMKNALGRITGTVLQPGETFSFNGTVGRRTAANGFRTAGVIKNGELVDGLGGGVCQASTTVYGAAIRAGMEVVERGNHRWPSTYVPIGQDAMVSWGSQDMKFKNNTDYPVYIKSYMSGTKLQVMIYGSPSEEWDEIEISSWQTSTLSPGKRTEVKDPSLPKGTEKVKIKARAGSTASAQRTYYKDGKKVKTEALPSSRYNPVNETVLIGTAEPTEKPEPEKNEETKEPVVEE